MQNSALAEHYNKVSQTEQKKKPQNLRGKTWQRAGMPEKRKSDSYWNAF